MNTTLQISVKKQLREKAERVAKKQGFSSLQEVVRVFLRQFADGEITITFVPRVLYALKGDDV